ncbi:snRNA-activating protein complex subunit 3 [Trachymyrmex septentrionalis]|uniref:snRNA-activating protein complex subunit 3 n=1 Tax=Trachymyrmex septentrionalis TaxID=34720 RepID=A0A151JVR3_9HYME|nr:PREDICTED: snRNA-activating protein complex subunit 3 [Trachymyrmex septentrionalis]KYN37938.1 snRNA-activating protein complex subunit 3 [Trachymyrmex septentrionalis]
MDQVYKLYDRQASSKICIKDYFHQYSELIKSSMCYEIDKQSEEKIFQLMGTDLSQARILLMKHYCSIDNLTLPVEAAIMEEQEKEGYVNIPEKILDNVSLETIKVLEILSKQASVKPRNQNGIPIKYDKSRSLDDNFLKPYEEFLVYIRIYEPFKSQPRSLKYRTSIPVLKLKSVISILGSQTLYELRQKIMCQSDLSITKEISENPNQRPESMAKDVYQSGFFYIEDTFYNDTSVPTNIDYSNTILEWATVRDIGPFKIATMDALINSLYTKFGFPWVYQHQGCCEHLIVLTDARLVTVDDVLTSSAYPRIEKIRPVSGKNCIYCGIFNVHWIVTEHDRIPHDTSYFCNRCFISYNYVDGKKVGNFKAYSYPCIPQLMSIIRRPKKS